MPLQRDMEEERQARINDLMKQSNPRPEQGAASPPEPRPPQPVAGHSPRERASSEPH